MQSLAFILYFCLFNMEYLLMEAETEEGDIWQVT